MASFGLGTDALDVSVQSSLVDLLRTLQADIGLTLLFITHNIALVRNIAQQVAVLEPGRIIEFGEMERVSTNPQHRYTQSLIKATPNFQLASTPLTGTPASGEQPHDPAQRGLLPVRSL